MVLGTKPWEYIKRGLEEDSSLTDKEIMAVIDEMKKAVNIIHNEHLNPEKEKKYGWLERKYAAERKWRGHAEEVKSAIRDAFNLTDDAE